MQRLPGLIGLRPKRKKIDIFWRQDVGNYTVKLSIVERILHSHDSARGLPMNIAKYRWLAFLSLLVLCVARPSIAGAQEEASSAMYPVRDPAPVGTIPEQPNALLVDAQAYAERSRRIQRAGMGVLGGWSVANLGVGCSGWALSAQERVSGFHEMNCVWNGVNAGLATAGLFRLAKPIDPQRAKRDGRRLENTLLFNAGLDVGYVIAGLWLRERGKRLSDPRMEGWGDALFVQGGFLFTFDIGLFAVHSKLQ